MYDEKSNIILCDSIRIVVNHRYIKVMITIFINWEERDSESAAENKLQRMKVKLEFYTGRKFREGKRV